MRGVMATNPEMLSEAGRAVAKLAADLRRQARQLDRPGESELLAAAQRVVERAEALKERLEIASRKVGNQ
jgi:hypothetical protein